MAYRLGNAFASLQAHGASETTSLGLRHALTRSRALTHDISLQLEQQRLYDDIDLTGLNSRRSLETWTVGFSGRYQAPSKLDVQWRGARTLGRLLFMDAATEASDSAAARAGGDFGKWTLESALAFPLDARDSLNVHFVAQWADRNLDSASKLSASGPAAVRAFDVGLVSGDAGTVTQVEWRHRLDLDDGGWWTLFAFADVAELKINQNSWSNTPNSVSLEGAGLGLIWERWGWNARMTLAIPVYNNVNGLAPYSNASRVWLELKKAV